MEFVPTNYLGDLTNSQWEQIEAKQYAAMLTAKGIGRERIRKLGFAFHGKKVRIKDFLRIGENMAE